ncbi:hypothetical protein C1752_00694 [Acaryochloris thomasi RCC1774]|uniref:Uncharacterized protein n=1 Tax=Acaryochloris thomasi RCC1774 TaxID=1764569 RepID=A0A2W1JNT9_9CYAN|nr:hypothetical protein [Acaryochloris thomasi]PZD74959.1 hypothetical protein C1752_00694 [Acaryochloris thomasi RCC1774]
MTQPHKEAQEMQDLLKLAKRAAQKMQQSADGLRDINEKWKTKPQLEKTTAIARERS